MSGSIVNLILTDLLTGVGVVLVLGAAINKFAPGILTAWAKKQWDLERDAAAGERARELAQFKSDLQGSIERQKISRVTLHQRRDESIANLYGQFLATWRLWQMAVYPTPDIGKQLDERLREARTACETFRFHFFSGRLYLTPGAIELLANAYAVLEDASSFSFSIVTSPEDTSVPESLVAEYEKMDEILDGLQPAIESQFRRILGSDE